MNRVKAGEKGIEQQKFNPSHSRVNNDYDNQTKKSLAYSIFKVGGKFETDAASEIASILSITFTQNQIKNWWKKFNAKDQAKKPTFGDDALKTFLTVKKQKTLSDESINALIKYKFTANNQPEKAVTRINTLFSVSLKTPITLQQVQVRF